MADPDVAEPDVPAPGAADPDAPAPDAAEPNADNTADNDSAGNAEN